MGVLFAQGEVSERMSWEVLHMVHCIMLVTLPPDARVRLTAYSIRGGHSFANELCKLHDSSYIIGISSLSLPFIYLKLSCVWMFACVCVHVPHVCLAVIEAREEDWIP